MKHIFILHDTKKHHDFEPVIRKVMKDHDYELLYTTSLQDSVRFIKKYPVAARVYAVGGDGTVHGLLQAVVHTEHEFVVIPLGTGNDFCRTLTKEKSPTKLLSQSLELPSQKVDTILMNDTYYLNAACFGLDSTIANHVHDTPNLPFVPDSKSYIVSILQHVVHYRHNHVKIMSQGECLYQGNVILCTLNNAQYYGGGFPIIPHADICDGKMDICVVDHIPKAKIPYMITKLLKRQLNNRKEVHYYQVEEASVICENSCNIDGEEMKCEKYHFQIQPQSLRLVHYNG